MTPMNLWALDGMIVEPRSTSSGRSTDLDQEKSMSTNLEVSNLELWALAQWKPPLAHSIIFLSILCICVKLLAITIRATSST